MKIIKNLLRRIGPTAKSEPSKATDQLEVLIETVEKLSKNLGASERAPIEANIKAVKGKYIKKQPEFFERVGYLRYLATAPKTIIDVGVQSGTPKLYEAFDHLPFVLIDPQRNAASLLKHKPKTYRFVEKGLGAAPGILTLNESASQSSFLEHDGVFAGHFKVKASYDVEVTTFRDLVEELKLEPPFGVKIDTEGFELEVVKGMVGYFDKIDFLICETSVRRVFKDSYQFSELVAFLADHDMLFFNILNDTSPWPRYYDTVFLHKDHEKFKSVR